MAIVTNWAEPLEDALLKQLSGSDLSVGDLDRVCRMAALLEGAPLSGKLAWRINDEAEKLEKRYQQALNKTRESSMKTSIQAGINDLKKLGDYKDSAAAIREAEQKIERIEREEAEAEERGRKRKRALTIAAVVAVVALIAGLIINSSVTRSRVLKTIAEARAQVEAGQTDQAVQTVRDLAAAGRTGSKYEDLYDLTESALERVAADSGYEAAFELYDSLWDTASDVVRPTEFWDHAVSRLGDETFPPVDRWELLALLKSRRSGSGVDGVTEEEEQSMLNGCIAGLTDEIKSGSHRDMAAWVKVQRDGFDALRMDPEAALGFVYAMNDAGYDTAALFPGGLKVDIPLGESVQKLTARLTSSEESNKVPDMTAVLPVSVVESDIAQTEESSYSLKNRLLCEIVRSKETDLNSRVVAAQSDDAHYTVRLLPEYLARIDEELRPATFADCTALVCMQNSYLASGTLTTITEYDSWHSDKVGYVPATTSREYRNCFAALDLVTVYDLSDSDLSTCLHAEQHSAQVEDSAWFAAHKEDSGLHDRENMMGSFDPVALKSQYDEVIDNLLLYRIILNIDDMDAEEDSYDVD